MQRTAWLIEGGASEGGSVKYLTLELVSGFEHVRPHDWTWENPDKALQFARKQDAENFAKNYLPDHVVSVIEHMWVNPSPEAQAAIEVARTKAAAETPSSLVESSFRTKARMNALEKENDRLAAELAALREIADIADENADTAEAAVARLTAERDRAWEAGRNAAANVAEQIDGSCEANNCAGSREIVKAIRALHRPSLLRRVEGANDD